jgi:hypothetical protein
MTEVAQSGGVGGHRLDELGWLQFERLAHEASTVPWHERETGRGDLLTRIARLLARTRGPLYRGTRAVSRIAISMAASAS